MKPKIEDEAPVEKALAGFIKSFKGYCHNCGKYGHKGADCSERKHVSGWKSEIQRGKCWFCKQEGHKIYNCAELKAIKSQHGEIVKMAIALSKERQYYPRDSKSESDVWRELRRNLSLGMFQLRGIYKNYDPMMYSYVHWGEIPPMMKEHWSARIEEMSEKIH
ncbi:hypothetical protein ACHAWF_000439 [Thalassiosira exigua]